MLMVLALITAPLAVHDAQLADLRCIAALTSVTSSLPEADRGGVAAGVMFYIGRVEGRDPGIDISEAIIKAIADEEKFAATLPQELKRCGTEMQVKGASLTAIGERLRQYGAR